MADQPEQPPVLPKRADDEFAAFRHPDDASFDKFVAAIDRAYHRPFVMMWRSFLQGVATALGATVGAGIVFILLFYVLRNFNFSPVIQNFQDIIIPKSIRDQLDQSAATTNQVNTLIQQVSPSVSPTPK